MNRRLILAVALLAGCNAVEKAPAEDTFSELNGVDQKADLFVGKMTVVGSIGYGETQGPFNHPANKWSALKFAGDAGDVINVDVKSTNGDTVAWVLDNDFNILGYDDDSGVGTNSHIDVTLTANASRTHYIVTRDYYKGAMKFSVVLKGKPAKKVFDAPCNVDADCGLVRPDCCSIQNPIGVRADQVAAYRASLGCAANLVCPRIAIRDNHASAECVANKCVAVLPGDVACGGRVINHHECPADWVCEGAALLVDGTGKCSQRCGGIRGLGCDGLDQICVDDPNDSCDPSASGADCMGECRDPICSGATSRCAAGYHWDQFQCNCIENTSCGGFAGFPCAAGKTCVDVPDSCDPAHGGADCPGMCVAQTDCRSTGCGTGKFCSFCWGSYACIPNGALC